MDASDAIGCLTKCGKAARNRGLCEWCKVKQNMAIARGETTEAELIAKGLRLPRRGRWKDMGGR